MFCPPAFYKVAFIETKADGKLEVFSWIMHNDDSSQPKGEAEVSLLLIERLIRYRFLTPPILERVNENSISRHISLLKKYDEKLEASR